MKKLLITRCPDPMRWYADKIGQYVPFIGDVGTEYRSKELVGYCNFVQYDDCDVVEVDE